MYITQCQRGHQEALPPEIQRYFQNPQDVFGEAIDVLKFQENNKDHLLNHLLDKVTRQRQVLVKVRDEMVHIKAVKNEVQALRQENERLRQLLKEKEKALMSTASSKFRPQVKSVKQADATISDTGPAPQEPSQQSGSKHRKTSISIPISVTAEKSWPRTHNADKALVTTSRTRSQVSVASSVKAGKHGAASATPVPPSRISLVPRPAIESPRVVLQPVANKYMAHNQVEYQQPMGPQSMPPMGNYGIVPQSYPMQQSSFQSPALANGRLYQVPSIASAAQAPVPQPNQQAYPSYSNRISASLGPPNGIYPQSSVHGTQPQQPVIMQTHRSISSARATWVQQGQMMQQQHQQHQQQQHRVHHQQQQQQQQYHFQHQPQNHVHAQQAAVMGAFANHASIPSQNHLRG
ncbi:hypothetical protein BGZ94_009076 [Podila epigama]|nr:hypothetical protein BGZ94_009076 [Podila epigama]